MARRWRSIDLTVQRATEMFVQLKRFNLALGVILKSTNTIGPIITAQQLLKTSIPIGTVIFMSSDSGSAAEFRSFEDGSVLFRPKRRSSADIVRWVALQVTRLQRVR